MQCCLWLSFRNWWQNEAQHSTQCPQSARDDPSRLSSLVTLLSFIFLFTLLISFCTARQLAIAHFARMNWGCWFLFYLITHNYSQKGLQITGHIQKTILLFFAIYVGRRTFPESQLSNNVHDIKIFEENCIHFLFMNL